MFYFQNFFPKSVYEKYQNWEIIIHVLSEEFSKEFRSFILYDFMNVDKNNMENIICYFNKNRTKKDCDLLFFAFKKHYIDGQHLQRNVTVIISSALIITRKTKTWTTLKFL